MINSKRMYFVNLLMQLLPGSSLQKIKASLFRWAGVEIGNNVELEKEDLSLEMDALLVKMLVF